MSEVKQEEVKLTKDQCVNAVDYLLKLDAGKIKRPEGKHKMQCSMVKAELEFPIKAIDPERLDNIKMDSMDMKKGDVKNIRMFNMKADTILAACDLFTNADVQAHFGVHSPIDLLKFLLLPGEIDSLYSAINKLMGFDEESEEELDKEVKN